MAISFTSIAVGADANAATFNAPLTELANGDIKTMEGFSGVSNEYLGGDGVWSVPPGTGGTAGHVIQDEGTPLTQRGNLNFTGDLVSATDAVSATDVDVDLQNDASPTFGGPVDMAGHAISDSVHTVEINDTLEVIGGAVKIDNSQYLRGEDVGGTDRALLGTNNADYTLLGQIDASWGVETWIMSGAALSIYVNGSSGAHSLAAQFTPAKQLNLEEDIRLNNNQALLQKDSGGSSRSIMNIDASNNYNTGHNFGTWGAEHRANAGTDYVVRTNRAVSLIEAMRVHAEGDVTIGTTANPTANGGKTLFFGDNVNDPTPSANTAGLFAKDVSAVVELQAQNDAGTVTQLTSHKRPTGMEKSPTAQMPTHTLSSYNVFTGERVTYDIDKIARILEKETGEKIIFVEQLHQSEIRDWDEVQLERQAAQERRIAEWEKTKEKYDELVRERASKMSKHKKIMKKWAALKPEIQEKVPEPLEPKKLEEWDEKDSPPEKYQPKAKPGWLK